MRLQHYIYKLKVQVVFININKQGNYLPGVPIRDPGVPTLELGVPYCSGELSMSISLVGGARGGEENSRSVCGDEALSLLSLGGCGDVTSDVRMVAPCVSPLTAGGEENKSFPETAVKVRINSNQTICTGLQLLSKATYDPPTDIYVNKFLSCMD